MAINLKDFDPAEIDGLALSAKIALAKRSYADYFLCANPKMKLYPHTKLITDKLQKIIDGEQHFYIISMPPTAREESYNY